MIEKVGQKDDDVLTVCVTALNNHRVIVVPTARWYMFAAIAGNNSLAESMFRLKRRPPDKSLLLIAPDYEWAYSNFIFSESARKLAKYFWPGDLSLRLRWQSHVDGFSAVGVPVGLVGFSSGLLGDIASAVGAPLVTTSVNFSGTPAEGGTQPRFAYEQVAQMLDSHSDAKCVAVAVDGGICPLVEATTIVDCSVAETDRPTLERFGTVHVDALRYVLPALDVSNVRRDMDGFPGSG